MILKIKLLLAIFDVENCVVHGWHRGVNRNSNIKSDIFFTEIRTHPQATDEQKAIVNYYVGKGLYDKGGAALFAKGVAASDPECRKLLKEAAMSEYLDTDLKNEAKRLFATMTLDERGLGAEAENQADTELSKNWLNQLLTDPAVSLLDKGIIRIKLTNTFKGIFQQMPAIVEDQTLPVEVRYAAAYEIVSCYTKAISKIDGAEQFSPLAAADYIKNNSSSVESLKTVIWEKMPSEYQQINFELSSLIADHARLKYHMLNPQVQHTYISMDNELTSITQKYDTHNNIDVRIKANLSELKAQIYEKGISVPANKSLAKDEYIKVLELWEKIYEVNKQPSYAVHINRTRLKIAALCHELTLSLDALKFVKAILAENLQLEVRQIQECRASALFLMNFIHAKGLLVPAGHDVARTWKELIDNPCLPACEKVYARHNLTSLCINGRSKLLTLQEQKQEVLNVIAETNDPLVKAQAHINIAIIMIRENTPSSLTQAFALLDEAENEPVLRNYPYSIANAHALILENFIDHEKVTRAKIKSIYEYFQRHRAIVPPNIWALANFSMAHLYYCPEELSDAEKKEKIRHYREVLKCPDVGLRFIKMTADALLEMGEK